MLHEGLRIVHVGREVGEGHLRLNHPELGQVPGRIGVLGTEGGPKRVDVSQGACVRLGIELSRHGQVGRSTEKVVCQRVNRLLLRLATGRFVHVGQLTLELK